MPMLRRVVVASAIGALVVGWSNVVVAQQQQPQGTSIKIDGTVKQVVAQGILVTGKDGKTYGVGFTPTSKVGLNGTTGIDYIKSGTYVQFDVMLDEKKQPTSEVKKIQITTMGTGTEPEIRSNKGPDGKVGEAGEFFVRGTVTANKNNTLTVTVGKERITVKVAENVTVPVTIADWRLAKEGDVITGDATSFGPQQGLAFIPAQGDLIEIKAAAPIDFKKGKK
jgi:hypothetical protein